MTPLWPAALPRHALRAGYEERPRAATVAFEPDAGEAIERPRFTVAMTEIAASMRMTGDQYALFRAFVRDELGGGAHAFLAMHPARGEQRLMKLSGEPRYAARPLAGDWWIVSFTMIDIGGD